MHIYIYIHIGLLGLSVCKGSVSRVVKMRELKREPEKTSFSNIRLMVIALINPRRAFGITLIKPSQILEYIYI